MGPPDSVNRILAGLPAADLNCLLAGAEVVPLTMSAVLYEPGGVIRHAYFPTGGVISVVVNMSDGTSAEAGMVGSEGMLGVWLVLGADTCPFEAVIQEPGAALRVDATVLRAACGRSPALRDRLLRYTDGFLSMASQSAACNRLHPAEQRLCRWLLMSHDRVGADQFTLTQEYLGRMLGVRRVSITPAARKLQSAGLIRYVRGRMTILDRAGLEAAACECYRTVRARLDGLLPPPGELGGRDGGGRNSDCNP